MRVHAIRGEKGLANTFFLLNSVGEAIVIDPGDYEQIKKYLQDNDVIVKYIILTHGHWDHIMGLEQLREDAKCVVLATKSCSEVIMCPKKNLSRYRMILSEGRDNVAGEIVCRRADITFEKEYWIEWDGQLLKLIETEGHSAGDCCVYTDGFLFSGDTLLENVKDIFRMPGADSKTFFEKTLPILKDINARYSDIIVYPGHNNPMKLNDILVKIMKETERIT